MTSFRYNRLIQKTIEAGVNLKDLEFEIINFQDILSPEKFTKDIDVDKSISIPYADIPTEPVISEQT